MAAFQCILVCAAFCSSQAALLSFAEFAPSGDFDQYVAAFGRSYSPGSEEYKTRRGIFLSRMDTINAANAVPDALWSAGVNEFTDRTDAERSRRLGYKRTNFDGSSSFDGAAMLELQGEVLPTLARSVDWRTLHMSNQSIDQASCGSCWAFAAISMLQARLEIANSSFPPLSVQQLVSCVANPRDCGGQGQCSGATVELAIGYVMQSRLLTEDQFPYEATDGTCKPKINAGGVKLGIRSLGQLHKNQFEPLIRAVNDGPVAISADASEWFEYSGGIFTSCSSFNINHAIVLFGYGSQRSQKGETLYWLIKNSWGPTWGEMGYGRFLRKKTYSQKDCGIDTKPEEGTACRPYPKTDTACGCNGMFYDSVAVELTGSNEQA
jgi:hypothetical protein|eukprot:TRINITY_DN2029_c0_g1_i1.p1 TRINITY_DN2029_c0_g1~~TRINITY_DN2029_c0_g1_i1.p1  ORF type:complete len:379 (+),score=42.15 TRINITY_DN2029_c0_g1_i1:67-1203(+)